MSVTWADIKLYDFDVSSPEVAVVLRQGKAQTEHEFDALQIMRDVTPEEQQVMVALLKCWMAGLTNICGDSSGRFFAGTLTQGAMGEDRGLAILALAEKVRADGVPGEV